MLKGLLTASLLLAALAIPAIGDAQYIYVDTNGDGVHSAADRLNPSGATSLDIWLDTTHDRDGSLQTCNSHNGGPATGSPLDVFSYAIVLRTSGGTVSWGTFAPADPAYTDDGTDLADSHDTEFSRSRPAGSVTPPGLVKLGTIPVTVVSGAPSVAFGTSTPIDPSGFGIGFGTHCEGNNFANTYVLATPGDPTGDWFDTDGALAPATGNAAPVLSAPASASAAAGSPVTINAVATDADAGDVLTITESGAPSSLTFNHSPSSSPASASLSGTPTFAEAAGSPYSILWAVNDGAGGNGAATTSLTVTRTDTAPTVSAADTAFFAETIASDFGVSVSDAEGDAITSLTVSGLPLGADFSTSATNNSGFVEWTPASGQAGLYPVTFTATSGSPALSSSKTVIFKVGPRDRRPIVTLTPTTYTINEGQHIHLTPTASDPDGDPLTSFTCKGTQNTQLPAGVTFTTSADFHNGTFDWTPDFNQSSIYHFDLEATSVGSLGEQISAGLNGGGATVVLVINVRDTDRAPTVSAPASVAGAEGSPLTVNVSASDPDGNAISSLTATPFPAGAMFTPGPGNTTGTLNWTPDFTQEGAYDVTFRANALTLFGTATTHITVAHANAAPVLSAPSSQSVDEGALLSFTVSATDGDGDHVTLSAPSRPVGAGFTDHGDNTGTFDWTPGFGQAGTHTVTFAGNDGNGGVATATTAITVLNVNRAPSSSPGGPYSGLTGVPVNFNGTASSDPDGDALGTAWTFGDGGTGTGASPSHTYSAAGTFTVALTVTDTGTPPLSNTASTVATIASFFTARGFIGSGGNSTIKLNSGKPTWCAQLEPIAGNFALADVNLSTLVLTYASMQIPANSSRTTIGSDRDGNGIAEITACFGKGDLRTLLASLPNGKSHVTVTVEAGLTMGGHVSAPVEVDVQKSGGSAMEVAVSPNPLNPQAILSFVTERPGSVRVSLYDLSGRQVRTLLPESYQSAGYHELTIDGRGDHGEKLPSGVYFYEVRTAESVGQGRLTILK